MRILKSTNKWTVFFGVLTILSMAFIFYNSMQDAVASDERSLAIVAQVKPILDAGGRMTQKAFNDMVRAMAHLTEFAMLGFSMNGLFVSLKENIIKHPVRDTLTLLVSFTVAVLDEFLQQFAGRYTDIKDVVLDIVGALIGVLVFRFGICIVRGISENLQNETGHNR